MLRRAPWALLLCLAGCASTEFYRQDAEVSWERERIREVRVSAFQAQPNAWAVAEQVRTRLEAALRRGTVAVVEKGGQAALEGAVTTYEVQTTPGAPRRVQETTATTLGGGLRWMMEVTHSVRLQLAVRLVGTNGKVVWSKESHGLATDTEQVLMNWPGNDPVPPPAILPAPTLPQTYDRLKDRALDEAIAPLVAALTVHYGYKPLE